MHFPLIPLPFFLMNPWLQEVHVLLTIVFAVSFGVIGLAILAEWAGVDPQVRLGSGGTVRDKKISGLAFFGLAILVCVGGLYFIAPIVSLYIFWVVGSSIRDVFWTKKA